MKKIGTVNKTKQILEENGFNMKKKFGQNFLIDQNILSSIVSKAEINKGVNVIEIGPGIGSLTEHLLENANTYHKKQMYILKMIMLIFQYFLMIFVDYILM